MSMCGWGGGTSRMLSWPAEPNVYDYVDPVLHIVLYQVSVKIWTCIHVCKWRSTCKVQVHMSYRHILVHLAKDGIVVHDHGSAQSRNYRLRRLSTTCIRVDLKTLCECNASPGWNGPTLKICSNWQLKGAHEKDSTSVPLTCTSVEDIVNADSTRGCQNLMADITRIWGTMWDTRAHHKSIFQDFRHWACQRLRHL